MNCGETKGLLSEYVDEVLDEKTKALVDEHLSTCKDCQQEFASLKRLVKELGSLESVQPPKDFLKQLHERIEQRSRFSKILRTLFVPMRVKIPLEFAGAAVMAILIFSVLHFQQEQYKMAEAPVSVNQGRVAEKGLLESSVKGVKEDTYKPQLAYKTATAEQPQEKREPMELALVMKEELPSEAYAPGAALEAAPAAKKKRTRSLVMREAVPSAQLERDESVDDSVAKLTRLIELVGGKVLSIEYEKESNTPESIHAEIPAKQFSTFYNQLKELGDLQSAPKSVNGKDKEVIPVQIRLLPSR